MRVVNFCPLCGFPTELTQRYGKLRPVCTRCDTTVFFEPKVAVVLQITREDQVLLVQRANEPAKGTWALPAGFVDADEDPVAAAQRETLEETGLEVAVSRLIDVLHRPDPNGLADIVIAYEARITGGVLLAGDDAAAVGWYRYEDIPQIGFRTTELLLKRWVAERSEGRGVARS